MGMADPEKASPRGDRDLPYLDRQGVGRARSRLGWRTVRRVVWVAMFLCAGMVVYNHRDAEVWRSRLASVQESATWEMEHPGLVEMPELAELPEVAAGNTAPETHDDPSADQVTTITHENDIFYEPSNTPFDASVAHLRTIDPNLPRPKDYSPFYGGQSRRDIDIASDPLPLEATLTERLAAWRNAPGGRGEIEGEVELGGFMAWNLEECGTIEHSHNTHMIQVGATVWPSFNRSTLHRERERLITYMETLVDTPALTNTGKGRGIVMQAGNVDTMMRALWSIKYMRQNGCTLPVKIYCFPEELPPDDDEIYRKLAEVGAELTAAKGQKKDKGKNKSYHLKAIAMIENPFAEVLYLDSDSIPTRDPEYMFEAPNYKRLGIFATPDYWKTSAGNPIWSIMGVKCRGEWEMETGQMFVDKRLHLDVLWLVRYLLEHHDDEGDWPGYFKYSDGDKDLFRWAMLMLRKRWGVPGRWVAAGALPSNTPSGFCSHTMMQHDAWGEPLFVHYNLMKQIPSGIRRGYSWGRSKQLPMFNMFPATPATARLGEPLLQPNDTGRRGLGDIDCDMLADADEYGVARAPAKDMVMRRAARERGVKVKYHGGTISALCIDFEYTDPRPQGRREGEEGVIAAELEAYNRVTAQWESDLAEAAKKGELVPPKPQDPRTLLPDWSAPYEVVRWNGIEHLADFETKLYDLGFVPNGRGF